MPLHSENEKVFLVLTFIFELCYSNVSIADSPERHCAAADSLSRTTRCGREMRKHQEEKAWRHRPPVADASLKRTAADPAADLPNTEVLMKVVLLLLLLQVSQPVRARCFCQVSPSLPPRSHLLGCLWGKVSEWRINHGDLPPPPFSNQLVKLNTGGGYDLIILW